MKNSTYFALGTIMGGLMSLGSVYLMNKDTVDKAVKKKVKDAKNMIENIK